MTNPRELVERLKDQAALVRECLESNSPVLPVAANTAELLLRVAAQALSAALDREERLEAALRLATFRDVDGCIYSTIPEDVDLREYLPILDEIHPPQ